MTTDLINLPDIADGEDKSSPFANKIRNTYRHIKKWAKRTQTDCFRLYDREIAHYPLAIDFYAGRFCIQYFARGRDALLPSQELIADVTKALHTVFGISSEMIYWKTRSRSKETRQYEKHDSSNEFFTVIEYGVPFYVNLRDYLDTGLFLDHRETRQLVALQAKGKRLLNLFAYTSSFSIHAAIHGASFTKSVDMSNTYTDWSRENFRLNNLSLKNNSVVRADCLKFLQEEVGSGALYDLIVIDPPTISRSKKMDQLFDIQVDYIDLISKSLQMLAAKGIIFFSTNSRSFTFDESLFPGVSIKEISHKTQPIDFRVPNIHRCWQIQK